MLKLLRTQNNPDYYAFNNTKVSNYVAKQVDDDYDSYSSKLQSKKEGKHNQKVNPPRYKDKVKGRNVTTFGKEDYLNLLTELL